MLMELMAANAAFAVIKQTLMNGKEIASAGKAVGDYFTLEKEIQIKAANSSGDNLLEAFQAKKQLEKQEAELKFMLNKQSLLGYHEFQQFKAQFSRDRKDAERLALKKKAARAKSLEDNLTIAIKVGAGFLITMASILGAAIYIEGF